MPNITFYALNHAPCPVQPASPDRDWMDATSNRFAYRCLPLSIANSFGWDFLVPETFTASWNGRPEKEGVQVFSEVHGRDISYLTSGHFGSGILTMHLGYLIVTEPGWHCFVTGPINNPKHGIAPLSGLVETDWLSFTFTMNWKFTAPGSVTFHAGEVMCRVIPVPSHLLDDTVPEIRSIESNPELHQAYQHWADSRKNFNDGLQNRDPETVKQGWQKHYFKGADLVNEEYSYEKHKTKLRLAAPIDKRTPRA